MSNKVAKYTLHPGKMTLPLLFSMFFFPAALAPSPAHAVNIGDASRGLAYANEVCAECHLVDNQGPYSANPDAPSFKDIANTPGMTEMAITVWLQTSHPTMPNLIIPPQQTDDLIAYIKRLRDK